MSDDETKPETIAEVLPADKRKRPNRLRDVQQTTVQTKRILSLHAKGVHDKEISKAVDVPLRTVRGRIKQFESVFTELKNVEEYRKNKADVLDAAQLVMLKSMVTPEKLDKASVNNLAYAMRQCHDMSQISQGKPTALTGTFNITFNPDTRHKDDD
jgi:hypothetical protein